MKLGELLGKTIVLVKVMEVKVHEWKGMESGESDPSQREQPLSKCQSRGARRICALIER